MPVPGECAGEAAEPPRAFCTSVRGAEKLFQKTVYHEWQNYPPGYKLSCYANHRQPLLLNYTLQFPAAAVDGNSCRMAERQRKAPAARGGLFPAEGSCEGEFSITPCMMQRNYPKRPKVAFPFCLAGARSIFKP